MRPSGRLQPMRRINVAKRELVPAVFGWQGDRPVGNGAERRPVGTGRHFLYKDSGQRGDDRHHAYAAFYFLVSAVWLTVGDARCPGCWLKVKLALV